jgi:hypothetical protein
LLHQSNLCAWPPARGEFRRHGPYTTSNQIAQVGGALNSAELNPIRQGSRSVAHIYWLKCAFKEQRVDDDADVRVIKRNFDASGRFCLRITISMIDLDTLLF